MLRPVPAEVPSCRNPGSPPSRPASRARRSSAPSWQRGACYRGSPRRASRLIRSIPAVPPAPARIPASSQTRRASARPIPPPCPLSEAAPAVGCQQPLSRASACACRRPVPDCVRRDLADRDHEIIRPGRRQARPHSQPRRNPAHLPQVISAEPHPARQGETRRPRPTRRLRHLPLLPGRRRNKSAGSPCSQGCTPKSLRGHFAPVRSSLTTPRISPALRPRRKGWAEVGMGVAAAGGSAACGPVMADDGYGTLAAAGAVAATVVLPLAWPGSTARTGR